MMTEVPVNSEEDYYVDESFEEDTQSEVEEEQEMFEDDYGEDEANQKHSVQLEDESDTQSESDVEAEFMRGNVSEDKELPELTIKEFSLDLKNNVVPNPQPHARRQQIYSGRSNVGFGHKRMTTYPSSSSEDESQVVVTKTVAEVNQLSGVISIRDDDEALSVRTLKPGSAHKTVRVETEDELTEVEEVEEEEEVLDNIIEEDAESVDEEEQQDMESDDDQKAEIDASENDESGEEEQEQYSDEEEDPVVQVNMALQQDTVTVVDASDNSSDQSGPITKMQNALDNISLYSGNETDFTIVEERTPRKVSGIPVRMRPSRLPRFRTEVDAIPATIVDPEPEPQPQETSFEEPQAVEMPPLPQLEDFLNDGNLKPDAAAVKYLEQKMTQMSEMIMNSFRMSGGSAKNPALEQLAMATGMMQAHASQLGSVEEFEGISGSSAQTSSRSCGDEGRATSQFLRNSQETLGTIHSAKLVRPKCRCPSDIGSMADTGELQPGMEIELDDFIMDECGQGDGLMRHHPHRHRQQNQFASSVSSATPSSNSICGRNAANGGVRPRSSTDKVNKKNLGRKSFSFSNYQVREIERQNHILLKKMMTVKPTATIKASTSSIKCSPNAPPKQTPPVARLSSAAVNRKKSQRQIDLDNDVLKRKLEAIGTRRPQFK